MKKFIAIFLILLLYTGCSRKEKKIVLPLSEEEIQQAIEYGRKRAKLTFIEFAKDWTIDLGYEEGKGMATLITPFLRVALIGKKAAELGQKVDRKLIHMALEKEIGYIHFKLQLYGDTPTFGRELKIYLEYKGKKIFPSYLHLPPYSEFTRDYYNVVKGDVKFAKSGIPDDARIKLVVFYPEKGTRKASTCEFIFDLKKYR